MLERYRVAPDADYAYFMTSTIMHWLPLFLSSRYCNIILDALSYCREHKGLLLHAWVIMPTHFHIIASSRFGTSGRTAGLSNHL
jgi:hypothetical protein